MDIIVSGTRVRKSWRGLIYGSSGIGKTTWCSKAPTPLILDIEDGAEWVQCDRTPVIKSYVDFFDALRWFYSSKYETAIIDSLDVLEMLMHKEICRKYKWESIEDPGYGKGYGIAKEEWIKILDAMDISVNKGKSFICIGHDQIRNIESPDSDIYGQYNIKLNARSASLIVSRMDFVFFAQYEKVMVKDKQQKDRLRAAGTGDRILNTVESPCWIAKNRFNLNPVEPMDGEIFKKFNK